MTEEDFDFIDDPRVPTIIKPVTKLHDELVKGYIDGKDLKLPKLIRRIEKNLGEQVQGLVEIEDKLQHATLTLVTSLTLLREVNEDLINKEKTSPVLQKKIDSFIEEQHDDLMDKLMDSIRKRNNDDKDV